MYYYLMIYMYMLQERQVAYLSWYLGPNCFCIFLICLAVVLEAPPKFSKMYDNY